MVAKSTILAEIRAAISAKCTEIGSATKGRFCTRTQKRYRGQLAGPAGEDYRKLNIIINGKDLMVMNNQKDLFIAESDVNWVVDQIAEVGDIDLNSDGPTPKKQAAGGKHIRSDRILHALTTETQAIHWELKYVGKQTCIDPHNPHARSS